METVTDAIGKLWFLGAGVVAIAAYAVTLKVRLDYLEKNYDTVHADMETRLKEETETEPHKKRHELSKSATNSLKYHDVRVTVKFD